MDKSLLVKNWGFWLGIIERITILYFGIWTFFNTHLFYIQMKGLVSRQAFFIALIFVVPFLAWKRKISLKDFPFKTDAVLLSPLLVDTIGNFSSRFILNYDRWDFFDKIAHFWGSGVFTFLACTVLISRFYNRNKETEIFYFFWICVAIGVLSELFWEIWEYYYDFKHGTILVGGTGDTIGDIVAGFFGSLVFSGLYSFWYIKLRPESKKKYLSGLSRLFNGGANIQ